MKELAKTYNPKGMEDRIYKNWLDKKYFHAEVDRSKKPFTIVMPPPNITGKLHMGHALDNTMQDILIRYKRMQGYNALWVPGTDHASISTEVKVINKLKEEGVNASFDDKNNRFFISSKSTGKSSDFTLEGDILKTLGISALSTKERENKIVKEKKAVFLLQIGKILSNGNKHDGRSPDYDDFELNGDILVYNPVLDSAFELSSMGIRVNKESLLKQLEQENKLERLNLEYHQLLLNDKLPLTIGGGIGQSRMCMFFLNKRHIGEVQSSYWPDEVIEKWKKENIELL